MLTAGYGRVTNGKPETTVLWDGNAAVNKRSVLGVIGESGCGKSTLARVIAGLLPAAEGELCLDDHKLEGRLADRSLKELQRVQIVFQMADVALNPRQRIGDILGRYDDGIAIRQVDWGIGNDDIRAVAEASRVPVLNMQCDQYHPFQALADLLTVIEQKGDPRKLTVNVSYAYAASYQKPISVPQSEILLMTRYGANVRLTRPPEFKLMPEIVAQAEENAKNSHGSVRIVDDFEFPGIARQPDFPLLGLVQRMWFWFAPRDVSNVVLRGQPGFEVVAHSL